MQCPTDRRLGCIGPGIGEERGGQECMRGRVRRIGRDRSVQGIDRLVDAFVCQVAETEGEIITPLCGICHSASTRTIATAGVAAPDGASVGQCIDRPKRHHAAMPTGAMIVVPTLTRTITA